LKRSFVFGKKNKEVKNIEQEDAEMKLVQDIQMKFDDARNSKNSFVSTWDDCIDAYNSDYFVNLDRPDYKSDEISNFIFATIETIKPIMVDNNPKIVVLPKTPDGLELSDEIQDIFDYEWKREKMNRTLQQAVSISLQIGTAVFGVFWNQKDEGVGNVNVKLINPYNIFPDPMATSIDDAEYIIYATYKHVNLLKKQFPKVADKIIASEVNYDELISNGQDSSNVNNQVLVLECYMRDYTTIEHEEVDEENNKVKKKKMKYPKGRILTVAPELNLILSDKANPYNDGKFPFLLLKCYDVPFQFWGKGEIEQLLSPQTYINDLMNQIIDNAKLTANMPWIIDKNSGIGKGQLTNRPGLIVRKNPGTTVERKQPPQMPVYVQETIEVLKRDIEIISGVHDVTQGRKPGSVSAAAAIIALQEAAQARIRLKVKVMEQSLSDLGLMWYNRIKQYWITTRWIRAFGENNETTFIEVNPDKLQEDFDFVIEAGSTMPTNKNAMLDLMIRLAQTPAEDGLPMVDRETVLSYTNVPDRKKLVTRFAELTGMQQQQAQAQQEQAMMMQQQEMQQQMMMEQQKMQQQAEIDIQKEQQKALIQQTANTNQQITDEQIQAVLDMLANDPQLMAQLHTAMPGMEDEDLARDLF
jgi:hypothetical protein